MTKPVDLRLSNADLSDDEPYLIGAVLVEEATTEHFDMFPHQHWVPVRVMRVILGVASAYGAQLPARLPEWHERAIFNHQQAAWIQQEMFFVESVIDDLPVQQHAQRIAEIAELVALKAGALVLVFEGQ